jgi:hypothetical protein
MMDVTGNIFEHILSEALDEEFTNLLAAEGLRIERIISTGQASPPDFWYDHAWSEWVLVLSGGPAMLLPAVQNSAPNLIITLIVAVYGRVSNSVLLRVVRPQAPTYWVLNRTALRLEILAISSHLADRQRR